MEMLIFVVHGRACTGAGPGGEGSGRAGRVPGGGETEEPKPAARRK